MDNKIFTSNHILSSIPVHDAVMKLKGFGYDGIEVWAEGFFSQSENGLTSLAKVRSALAKTGLDCVVHAPLKDISGKKYNISSKDAVLRKRSIDGTIAGVNLAKSLGASLMNMHPGHADDEKFNVADYYQMNLDSLRKICGSAEKAGIIVSMETMEERPKEFVKTPQEIIDIIHELGHPNLGMTLDISHAYTHGKSDVERYLREIKKDMHHLYHCHVSGHSKSATHVPFAYCEIKDFWAKEIRKFLEFYHGRISIEGAKKDSNSSMILMSEDEIVKDNLKYIKSVMH